VGDESTIESAASQGATERLLPIAVHFQVGGHLAEFSLKCRAPGKRGLCLPV